MAGFTRILPTGQQAFIRVIPRADVATAKLTEFDLPPLTKFQQEEFCFLSDDFWKSDPHGESVRLIEGFIPLGTVSDLSEIDIGIEFSDAFTKKVDSLINLTERSTGTDIKFFGVGGGVQYFSVDVGKKCLFEIQEWVVGSAQVFYEISENGDVLFEFWDAWR